MVRVWKSVVARVELVVEIEEEVNTTRALGRSEVLCRKVIW